MRVDFFKGLTEPGRRAFWTAFGGLGLAGFDLLSFTFVLVIVQDQFGLSAGQVGWLATSSLLASAVGGVIGGTLADGIGRSRTMLLAILVYAVATFLCGFAQNFEQLLILRIVLGFGFGADFTASQLMVAEYAPTSSRGRLLGLLSSSFSLGDMLAAAAAAAIVLMAPADMAWRVLFWAGAAPAMLVAWARTRVVDPPVFAETRANQTAPASLAERLKRVQASFAEVFGSELRGITIAATLLASGALSGRYVVTIWLPTYLQSTFRLDQTTVSLEMVPVLVGSILGYVGGGYCQDRLGRKLTFTVFSLSCVAALVLYVRVPVGDDLLLTGAGLLLGICTSAVLSGLGTYLAELFPTRIRGLGQGFTYSTGRAVAALPVAMVGTLAAIDGLGAAIAGSAAMYAFCLIALRFLPETKGRSLDTAAA